MTLDKLAPGSTIDLKGQLVKLAKPLLVPPGSVTICNGKIVFDGDKQGVPGADAMSCFNTNEKSGQLHVENMRFEIPDKVSIVRTWIGGRVSLRHVSHAAGTAAYCHGGQAVELIDVWGDNPAHKYWFCNFSFLLKNLKIDNTGTQHWIKQGKYEAAVRLMQVDDAQIIGLKVQGSGVKQGVQDRPGGEPGARYAQHIWRNCVVLGGVDLGNFKDRTDKNFPFGRLGLSRWIDCDVDRMNTTAEGDNALSKKEMGIDKIELLRTKLKGKMTNGTK